MFKCKYCGKEVGNKGCLVIHETACEKNPNHIKNPNRKGNGGHEKGHIAWNKGLTKENDDRIKKGRETWLNNYKEGKFHLNSHIWTLEEKKHLSEKRKQWLLEHKDDHIWRRDSKFLSIPCENLKQYLRNQGINFVEEYEPFDDINYCIDIAWPDEKIAIEVNGNQHYNKDGSLSKYYQKRHNLFKERGWKVFEIHYTKCYNININDFEDILKLPIYDKNYVNKYFSKKEQKKKELELKKQNKEKEKEFKRNIIIDLKENSGIDFNKFGWVHKSLIYIKNKYNIRLTNLSRYINNYYPEFFN